MQLKRTRSRYYHLLLAVGLLVSQPSVAGFLTIEWTPWPDEYPSFDYSAEELFEHWEALHTRDHVPRPSADYVLSMAESPPDEPHTAAAELLDGWRQFHAGNFQEAYEIGISQGRAGYFLANRAWLTHALHLIEDEALRLEKLEAGIRQIEQQILASEVPPTYWELAGAAMVYGQYSKLISSTRAAREGVPGRVKELAEAALEQHAEIPSALGVMGGYHTEVIDRVGGMLARMTYGARRDTAREYFERTLAIDPELIQARVEYAEALLRLYGDRHADEAKAQLEHALSIEPKNAEDYLEQLRAKQVREAWQEHLQ
ncbi:hypothetical protein CAI21_03270 [Alkalilimnicola ehrlichii]|uniref:Uncharacterized protein n=1 Tax=Alkalilimnicola ehrlichii TaxID=351052 RepID=A0A3E0X2A6_9GAMM|nr:hypothetical protein [Alkalilimnicola ehrlichii]RFA31006.1 hypothetical protein CAI21_03270 [Alkalilimnicola ehrlichii]RFA38959.1 hypothetical protein CAL65_03415 [Alkalilimnicola ehrlichii]